MSRLAPHRRERRLRTDLDERGVSISKHLRDALDIDQGQLGLLLGVHATTVFRWEREPDKGSAPSSQQTELMRLFLPAIKAHPKLVITVRSDLKAKAGARALYWLLRYVFDPPIRGVKPGDPAIALAKQAEGVTRGDAHAPGAKVVDVEAVARGSEASPEQHPSGDPQQGQDGKKARRGRRNHTRRSARS